MYTVVQSTVIEVNSTMHLMHPNYCLSDNYYVYTNTCRHTHLHTHMHKCAHTHILICSCTHTHIHVHVNTYIHIHITHAHTHDHLSYPFDDSLPSPGQQTAYKTFGC